MCLRKIDINSLVRDHETQEIGFQLHERTLAFIDENLVFQCCQYLLQVVEIFL